MEELLNLALEKYPTNTKIKSLGTGLIAECGSIVFINYVGDICIRLVNSNSNLGVIRVYSKLEEKWADII